MNQNPRDVIAEAYAAGFAATAEGYNAEYPFDGNFESDPKWCARRDEWLTASGLSIVPAVSDEGVRELVERLRDPVRTLPSLAGEQDAQAFYKLGDVVVANQGDVLNAMFSMDRAASTIEGLASREAALQARVEELEKGLRSLGFGGSAHDEQIGWRGTHPKPSTTHHFRCEFCFVEHIDCTEMPHTDECPVTLLRALSTAGGKDAR